MCAIVGAYAPTGKYSHPLACDLIEAGMDRGRDAIGWANANTSHRASPYSSAPLPGEASWFLATLRGTPTPEWTPTVPAAHLQPYRHHRYTIVHNGTIANDRHVAAGLGLDAPPIDSMVIAPLLYLEWDGRPHTLAKVLGRLKGSYALAIYDHDTHALTLACNYKPLFTCLVDGAYYFASLPHMLPSPRYGHPGSTVQKVAPYSVVQLQADGRVTTAPLQQRLYEMGERRRALAVLSGGLDSTTATQALINQGYDVTLLHFEYHCRAQARERAAVEALTAHWNLPLLVAPTDLFTTLAGGSTLTSGGELAGGEAGAEYAHEWVPARNLVMAATAVAVAEAHDIEVIALGNNLEESGAYPDNEQELIRGLNALMPNAVNEGHHVRFAEPVGNLMKHEIVATGHAMGAPLHLSYSCYAGGDLHCGQCGPCYMRAHAFTIAGVTDPTEYAQ